MVINSYVKDTILFYIIIIFVLNLSTIWAIPYPNYQKGWDINNHFILKMLRQGSVALANATTPYCNDIDCVSTTCSFVVTQENGSNCLVCICA